MTIQEFAQSIIDDPAYRETVRTRALAGTLPPDVELFLLESADGRLPLSKDRDIPAPAPVQSRTFALIRPDDWKVEEEEAERG
jgi:hypothetical protein